VEHLVKPSRLVIAVLAVSAAGIVLRYYNLDTYIIIIGFRFHISLILPFLIVFRKSQLPFIKQIFVAPHHKRTVLPLLWVLLPVIIVTGVLFLIHKIDIGDPDYFYEFGLSSIIDYPIYLLWNFPQLFCLFIFLALTSTVSRKNFLLVSSITFLVFAFEFIPFKIGNIDYFGIASLVLISISVGLLIKYFQNIYWLTISIFSIFWLHFLIFGSTSGEIVHILFASQYSGWDGFLEINKWALPYLLPAQLVFTLLLILISSFFRKKAINNSF
jgi:hypothetical protein